jgi:hypothetical protein
MADIVYLLCAVTSMLCAVLLWRGYRRSGVRLLLWSALCFTALFLNNVLLIVDVRIGPSIDLSVIRTLPALVGVALMIYGLVWDARN